MGQKVNPIGYRLSLTKDWRSRWFAQKRSTSESPAFGDLLREDLKIRSYVKEQLKQAAVSKIVIERFAKRIRVTVHTARPGLVFGRKRQDLDQLKEKLFKLSGGNEIIIDVKEIKKHELDAQLVAESIASQIERRVNFRRAMKKSIQATIDAGADGIRIRCAGRLNGAELSRQEQYREGRVPLHTLSANVQYGVARATTPAGIIGIKVWMCLPDNIEEILYATNAKKGKVSKGTKGKPGRQRAKK
ncbi:MAG: 30S ribosomal protein S3 [Lentisphaeria bacterium]|nr:30S ribosomal protein S3 [Lentisphaeria bacterium]NQZ67483.1 30S ribosomal protein S3 [Lentisphaeria bacterium]